MNRCKESEKQGIWQDLENGGQLREWRSGKERLKKRLCERMRGCVRPGPQNMDHRNLATELRFRVKEK